MGKRIDVAKPPYSTAIQKQLDKLTPEGDKPLALFTMLARDERLFARFMAGGLLDRGHLTLRQRELAIDRITARCGAEYEWGVHIKYFAKAVGLTAAQQYAIVHGEATDPCWAARDERLILHLCDTLQRSCDIDDALWAELRQEFSEMAILELILLCGFYRTVSYLANGTRLPLEPGAARFPARQ